MPTASATKAAIFLAETCGGAAAAGSVFTLLPPDNATGNFTKIVQRVPVRLRLPASVAAEDLIRPGMSVVVDVDTRTGPTSVASR